MSPAPRLALVALSMAAAAPAAEPAWQAEAKGLTEGLLCSLVLRVRIGESLDLVASGGTLHVGWGNSGPCEIPLGSIALADDSTIAKVERSGDWSGGKAVATFAKGGTITLHASMLSPGIAIETSAQTLRLFAGQHDRTVSFAGKKMTLHGLIGGKPLPRGKVTPRHLAVPHGESVRVLAPGAELPPLPLDRPWLLAWWGTASHFAHHDGPLAGRGFVKDVYQADLPVLLAFDAPPVAVRAADAGGLDVDFGRTGARLVVLPLYGARVVPARTERWAAAFPAAVAALCDRLVPFARQYPRSARETFRYDAGGDVATFTETVTFLEVGPGGRQLAPLPPIAALASQRGLALGLPKDAVELGVPTAFGPLVGAADAETVTWSVRGLGKYVAARRVVDGMGKVPASLEAELATQMTRLLEDGRLLAPWAYADNVPINASRGEYYWGEPGEVLRLLAELLPVVAPRHAGPLAERIAAWRTTHPPETKALVAPDAGLRRGGYDLGPCQLTKRVLAERGGRVSPFALYGLARFYAHTKAKPDERVWAACEKILDGAFEEQAWATLYLLGHPDRVLSWMKKRLAASGRLKEFEVSAWWRGDRPAAVVNANRQFAAALGAVRLARLAGDAGAEQRAWWLLARAAVLRFAMGKHAAWQYAAGLVALPPDRDWFWQWRQRFPQSWGGDLETDDWSQPAHDVRQVVELAPDRVELAHWAGVAGNAWTQRCTAQLVAFRHMVPELALFLRDHLRDESAALVRRVAWNHPVWYASFAEAILGWEHNMSHPSNAYQLFMAHAQILGTPPDRLAGWIDVPWLDRGDLFHLGKLAETLKACRGVRWETGPRER